MTQGRSPTAARSPSLSLARRYWREETGIVAALFAIMLVPLIAAVGVAVDFSRAAQFEAALQGAVNSAALAGASAYTSPACPATAVAAATNYMNAALKNLPAATSTKFTVTPGSLSAHRKVTGYTIAVAAAGQVQPTFMSLFVSAMPAAASATAENPVVTASIQLGSFNSSAYDANSVDWYPVPCDGSSIPPLSALTRIYSNLGTSSGSVTLHIASTQRIGFALVNETDGKYYAGYRQDWYGNNQYGGTPGSVHYFYSHLPDPNGAAYPAVTQNCSLQVFVAPTGKSPTAPPQGSCFTTPFSDAAPSCAELGAGQTAWFDWNDMGGNPDDKDYNDAAFSFSCSASSNGNQQSGVILVK